MENIEGRVDSMIIRRTAGQIDEQLNRAADGVEYGSQVSEMSAEQAIQDFALWLAGEDDVIPFPNPNPNVEEECFDD